MAKPIGWKEDSHGSRWHSLGLVDGHIKSLKKQVEVLGQELRSALAEREQLLNELGVLQWPGLERDVRFLQKLPGSVRKGNIADWRGECRSGRLESQNGNDGQGDDIQCIQVHRRGQTWNGWDNKTGSNERNGQAGRKGARSRMKSLDTALVMENLPFEGALPTHRGPAPGFDNSAGGSCEGKDCRNPSEQGNSSVSSHMLLSSIIENEEDPTSDGEENRDCETAGSVPENPCRHTDSDPFEEDVCLQEPPMEDPQEEGTLRSPAGPTRWLSNSAFHHTLTDSPIPADETKDHPEAGVRAHHPHVRMRTAHTALVERANRAARLSKELFHARFALHDSQSQLQFLTERMMTYKNNFQDEVRRHEEEANKLRGMLNEATTAKFIMFCKLSECQEKVQQLEEDLVVSRAYSRKSLRENDENIDHNSRPTRKPPVMDRMDSARTPRGGQSCPRASSMSTLEIGGGKLDKNVVETNLQRRLTETMRRLLEAQNRGDQLQQRLQELEVQLKKGGEDTRSVLSSDVASVSSSQGRVNSSRTWADLKQTRIELKRTRLRLHKCEEELTASNRIRNQQESDLGKLKQELKEAKRRRPPKWR